MRPIRNRVQQDGVGTKRLPQMDCDWQNPGEGAANNYTERLKFLSSNAGRIVRAVPRQTSDTRDVLSRFAMMTSLLQTSDVSNRATIPRIYVGREACFQTAEAFRETTRFGQAGRAQSAATAQQATDARRGVITLLAVRASAPPELRLAPIVRLG